MFAEAGVRMTLWPPIFEAPAGLRRANRVWAPMFPQRRSLPYGGARVTSLNITSPNITSLNVTSFGIIRL
jgi:hypothetical protein